MKECTCCKIAIRDDKTLCETCNALAIARAMSDRDLRIAVAKQAGLDVWTWVHIEEVYYREGKRCDLIVPDFPNSLEAMNEIERRMTGTAHSNFTYWLIKTVDGKCLNDYVSASARHRAEAYYISNLP